MAVFSRAVKSTFVGMKAANDQSAVLDTVADAFWDVPVVTRKPAKTKAKKGHLAMGQSEGGGKGKVRKPHSRSSELRRDAPLFSSLLCDLASWPSRGRLAFVPPSFRHFLLCEAVPCVCLPRCVRIFYTARPWHVFAAC